MSCVPGSSARKHKHSFDEHAYRVETVIERMFSCLKDWRCIVIRYEKLVVNFSPAIAIIIT